MKKVYIYFVVSLASVIYFGIKFFSSFEIGEDFFSTDKISFFGLLAMLVILVTSIFELVLEKKNKNND
ncbi:MAG: hypothetical protein V8R16_01970 [Bacilli bacterium]